MSLNIKNWLLTIAIFPAFTVSYAQSLEQIKGDSRYLWGEGHGSSENEADRAALDDLMSRISVNVASDFVMIDTGDSTAVHSVVNTYSRGTLYNTRKIIDNDNRGVHVVRWMTRADAMKVFDDRKAKIRYLLSVAGKADRAGKADAALKNYYWALALTRSLQRPAEMIYSDEETDENHIAISWIPQQLSRIMNDIDVKTLKQQGNDIDLEFTYKGKPVTSLDYKYYDGASWDNMYTARNGIGVLQLMPGHNPRQYQLKIEYDYASEASLDDEMQAVMSIDRETTPLPESYKTVDATIITPPVTDEPKTSTAENTFSVIEPDDYMPPEPIYDDTHYRRAMETVVKAVSGKRYSLADTMFTPSGLDIYNRLVKYGRARIAGTPCLRFHRSGDEVTGRGIEMSFSFRNGVRKAFVEEIVFTFTPEGKIDNLAFGLGETAENDILCQGNWPPQVRVSLMRFLEDYHTAYALKRLDFIRDLFDEDAVIIIGKMKPGKRVRRSSDGGGFSIDGPRAEFTEYDKNEFIEHLRRSFNSKEYINVRFAENEVTKLGKGAETYAIQIQQDYYSSNYYDQGYLMLLVDINDPQNPLIKFRAWQPQRCGDIERIVPGDLK